MQKQARIKTGIYRFRIDGVERRVPYRLHHLLVELKEAPGDRDRTHEKLAKHPALDGVEFEILSPAGNRWLYLRIDSKHDVVRLAAGLGQENPLVARVALDPVLTVAAVPGYDFVEGNPREQWGLECLRMFDAWDHVSETADPDHPVLVGLLDTGIPFDDSISPSSLGVEQHLETGVDHEDLDGSRFINGRNCLYDETSDKAYWPGDESPDDHGSNMAGIIAATRDNGKGIAGVNDRCEIYSSVVLGTDESGESVATYGTVATAVQHAADYADRNDARLVLNLSLRYRIEEDFDLTKVVLVTNALFGLFETAYEAGAVVCAAAGNLDGIASDFVVDPATGEYVEYPARFGLMEPKYSGRLLVVGAVEKDETIYSGSGHGNEEMVFAPGGGIETTTAGGALMYQASNGTSPATAHVSALAALVWREDPSRTPEEIVRCLKYTAREPVSGGDYRILDAHAAIRAIRGDAELLSGSEVLIENAEPDVDHLRRIELDVWSCDPATLEVSLVEGHGFEIPFGEYLHEPAGNPFTLPVAYAADDSDEEQGKVQIKWVETDRVWEIEIRASRA